MIIFLNKERELKRMKKMMILFMFLASSFFSFSQEILVSGTIIEKDSNTPLLGVSVVLMELQ